MVKSKDIVSLESLLKAPQVDGGAWFNITRRLEKIDRFSLNHRLTRSTVMEHSWTTGLIAYEIGAYYNKQLKYKGLPYVNLESLLVRALCHDTAEAITGDIPSPVKRWSSRVRAECSKLEECASKFLADNLSEEGKLKEILTAPYLADAGDTEDMEDVLIKEADHISALMECLAEVQAGNCEEFLWIAQQFLDSINRFDKDFGAARWFVSEYLVGYGRSVNQGVEAAVLGQ